MDRQHLINTLLTPIHERYDEKERLITVFNEKWIGGYHTRKKGLVHNIRDSADYAASVLLLEKEDWYPEAFQIFERICDLQDTDPESATSGLWSYFMEEDLKSMLAPDYNWSDFIGKNLIGVLILKGGEIPWPLRLKMEKAVRAAMACSIKRNVAPDYTNMSIMSSMTLISAGELLGEVGIFEEGRRRLRKLCQYTKLTDTFSEYNSSAYVLVALHEISRMLLFFRDEECREMARYLNRTAWKMLAEHYNSSIGQLTPPQARAYRDLDNGSLSFTIWQGTNGKYGSEKRTENISLEDLCFPSCCPADIQEKFRKEESWLEQIYYKKNDLRDEKEDTVIIRELDSPDRLAWSYMTEKYSMGSFRICDCWSQRRNCMVVWNKEHPRYFRIRALDGTYDFCSAMVYACQYRNYILGQLGLVTDRGSFHYILDQRKDGTCLTSFLGYRFELGGDSDDVRVRREGNTFFYEDDILQIVLTVSQWVWNGKEGSIRFDTDGKSLLLVGYEGDRTEVDTTSFGETYGIFSLEVQERTEGEWEDGERKRGDPVFRKENGMLISSLKIPDFGTESQAVSERKLETCSPLLPVPYAGAVQLSTKGMDHGMENSGGK